MKRKELFEGVEDGFSEADYITQGNTLGVFNMKPFRTMQINQINN